MENVILDNDTVSSKPLVVKSTYTKAHIKYYQKNKAAYSAKMNKYYQDNKELIKAKRMTRYYANKAKPVAI